MLKFTEDDIVDYFQEYLDAAYEQGQLAHSAGDHVESYDLNMTIMERKWFQKGWMDAQNEEVSNEGSTS